MTMKTSWLRLLLAAVLAPLSVMGLLFLSLLTFFATLPDVETMKGCLVTSMYEVRLCPGEPGYSRLSEISPMLVQSVIASEDAAFYSHHGFDWHEIRESLSENLAAKGFKRGASTLTQQLAKNVFLNKEKSLFRKIREAALTYQIERKFSKNEILEKYLNVVELGPNIFGVRAASQYYFKKAPRNLNVLESSFLAFLLPSPNVYHQSFAKKSLTPFAKKSVQKIVRRLEGFGRISASQAGLALSHIDQFPWFGLDLGSNDVQSGTSASPSEELIESVLKNEDSQSKSESDSVWDEPRVEEPTSATEPGESREQNSGDEENEKPKEDSAWD